ncbi:unnamed protein product [Medioppia subpectinata]|uniref:Tubulin-folding cofactor D ARM repeats domain-containing protein n=1 Tax=Medioppia subpectinata TaxID=1979941 RepID=A0A7R9Q8F7_9ACAR|nr:unnamed protein product [Medioppia subpectinata]CAG2116592.1 unnamed protein product [Medioppia subpectinata]
MSTIGDNQSSGDDNKVERICERFDYLISKWQTNPKLIESHVKDFLDAIIESVSTSAAVDGQRFTAAFTLMHPETTSAQKTLVERIYALIDRYLKATDKSRDSAAVLAAHFFARPDIVDQLLDRFMSESLPQLGTSFGHVMAVAVLLKVADRQNISPFAERVIEVSAKMDTTGRELMTKWKVKLIGRSALSLMRPRIAKWRYRRGRRQLSQNISLQMADQKPAAIQSTHENTVEDLEDDCDYSDIPEQLEVIIDSLLNALHHENTIVRWSSAKYLGRLTNRLPKEMAAEVVDSVLKLCEWKDSDSSSHGCCLALAELTRRGLILTDQLPQVVDVVQKALLFDELKGTFSIGSNVRDAACYVCWSLSRAYDSQVIQQFVHRLAPTLVCVVCFDRQVNCRRAASAAIQEFVGRTQVFPHGLEVLLLTDFHALATRSHCYLDIAFKLAQKPEFGDCLVQHLVDKCQHWDRDVRELVAQSLGLLSTVIDMNPYLPQLLAKSLSMDLNSRHGSILAIGHIIGSVGDKISPELREQMESIAVTLNEKKLLRGIGGEFMKQALSVLIEKCSSVSLSISSESKVIDVWIDIICNAIVSEDQKTRGDAVVALPVFCYQYLRNRHELKTKVLDQLLIHLNSSKESPRIGSSMCLQTMSLELLDVQYYNTCFEILLAHIRSGDELCGSRASEVITLVELSLKFRPIDDNRRQQIVDCLCLALDDRTKDSRGDVGGTVRLAAVDASLAFINEATDGQVIDVLKLMTTQCVSVWQKERHKAFNVFKEIVFGRQLAQIDRQFMETLFESTGDEKADHWRPFVRLLDVPLFTHNVWKGLAKNVSNPTETYVRNLLKQEIKSMDGRVRRSDRRLPPIDTYVSLLTADDSPEEALDLLTQTDWSQSLDVLRPIRDQICDALNVAKPRRKATGADNSAK